MIKQEINKNNHTMQILMQIFKMRNKCMSLKEDKIKVMLKKKKKLMKMEELLEVQLI